MLSTKKTDLAADAYSKLDDNFKALIVRIMEFRLVLTLLFLTALFHDVVVVTRPFLINTDPPKNPPF